jgi:nicotinate-nucleotide adenylyltransferase
MKKIGVMGGTFDPIHRGHLAVAKEACREAGLNEIIFLPAGQPYFKDLSTITAAEDRLNMLRLAVAGNPCYSISRLEIDRPGPSYAVESMARIRAGLEPEDELFFIMGWDSLMTLPLWYEADRLVRLCRFIAAPRPGYPHPDITVLEKDLPGISGRTIILEKPLIDISATEIRRRVSQDLPIDHLVVPEVAAYIKDHGLYR